MFLLWAGQKAAVLLFNSVPFSAVLRFSLERMGEARGVVC